MRNILMVANGKSVYDKPFIKHGTLLYDPNKLADCDLVVFLGGDDVSPDLYGELPHPQTGNNKARDANEVKIYNMAFNFEIPMTGICRGAQFLNVMNGGRLVQHVTNHGIAGTHPIQTVDGQVLEVTSTHHQMMLPSKLGKVLAWSDGLSGVYEGAKGVDISEDINVSKEPDAVWWEQSRSLGVQYHPEYMAQDSAGWEYYQQLLEEYVL